MPFSGDASFRVVEEKRVVQDAGLVAARREAVVDAAFGLVGVLMTIYHLQAPWIILFQMFRLVWTLHVLLALFVLATIGFTIEAILIHRRLTR